jgi:hypothetical protein
MASSMKRPHSSRERPVSGRTNIAPSPRPSSARPSSASRAAKLNDPLTVNRLYLADRSDLTPRIGSTMLPPSRYPTVYVDKDKDIVRYNKPPITPQSYIDNNRAQRRIVKNPETELKRSISETFVDKNYGRIQEYRLEYRGQTPRTITHMMINSSEFQKEMAQLDNKSRSVGKGTSSFQLRTCLYEGNLQEPVHTISTGDPNILSFNTSRRMRDDKVKKLFAPEVHLHATDKKYNRGYNHIPEYGNFSRYSGHLIKNQGAILNR